MGSWGMSLDNNYPNRKVNMKNRLKKLGFKKVKNTEPGFHMYELSPATLESEKLNKVEIEINETKHNLSSLEARRKKILEIINKIDSEKN